MIISINAKKAFDKIQCSFVILKKKTSQLNGYKNNKPHHNKVLNDKSTSNIILNGEKLKALSNIRTRTKATLATLIQRNIGSANKSS